MDNLFGELKRRNVFRVAVAYLIVGWIVVQVTDVAVPALFLPDWVPTLVFYFGLIGFPFAILFAWAFELTPDGVKKTSDVDSGASVTSQTGKKLEYMIIAGLVVAVAFLVLKPDDLWQGGGESAGTASAAPSIAVLPFEDFSPERDQEYFSSGIAEEILNLLAKTEALRVAARTSSFAFRGAEDDIRDIGRKLNVATVLEGSIRKSGGTLRITAQLINVEDGYHIWSETYDRELRDVFAIQDEIAASILQSLKVHLLGEVVEQTAVRAANMDAYNTYLIGRQRMSQQTKADTEAAKEKFEEAIALDPTFAPARAQLVMAALELERLASFGSDKEATKTATDDIALPQLAEANRLAADLPEVAAVQGLYHLRRFRYGQARENLDRAIALNPNFAQAYLWRADVSYEESDFKAMLADREMAYQMDPMSLEISRELANDYRSFWRPDDAERIIQRMFDLRPGHADAYWAKITNLGAQGKYAEAIPVLEEAAERYTDQDRFKNYLTIALIYIGEPDAARAVGQEWAGLQIALGDGRMEDALEEIEERLAGEDRSEWLWAARSYYRQTDDKENLGKILAEQIAGFERRGVPWTERCDGYLIEALRFAGMPEGTDTMMAECRERTEGRLKAGYLCPCSWFNLVEFALLEGRYEDAVMRANEWLDKGDSWHTMEIDTFMNMLRDQPEYDSLLRRNRDQMARQRRIYLEAKAAAASPDQSP